jgi:hypothetical protein
MNRSRTFSIVFLLIFTLLCSASSQASAQWQNPHQPASFVAAPATLSGGEYLLESSGWQISGASAGGGYLLERPAAPRLNGNGCCCTYLPCVMR